MTPKHRPSTQRSAESDARPLSDRRLVALWRQLPEQDRLSFLLALDEPIAARLMAATMPDQLPPDWRDDPAEAQRKITALDAQAATQPVPKRLDLDRLSPKQLGVLAQAKNVDAADRLEAEYAAEQAGER